MEDGRQPFSRFLLDFNIETSALVLAFVFLGAALVQHSEHSTSCPPHNCFFSSVVIWVCKYTRFMLIKNRRAHTWQTYLPYLKGVLPLFYSIAEWSQSDSQVTPKRSHNGPIMTSQCPWKQFQSDPKVVPKLCPVTPKRFLFVTAADVTPKWPPSDSQVTPNWYRQESKTTPKWPQQQFQNEFKAIPKRSLLM